MLDNEVVNDPLRGTGEGVLVAEPVVDTLDEAATFGLEADPPSTINVLP